MSTAKSLVIRGRALMFSVNAKPKSSIFVSTTLVPSKFAPSKFAPYKAIKATTAATIIAASTLAVVKHISESEKSSVDASVVEASVAEASDVIFDPKMGVWFRRHMPNKHPVHTDSAPDDSFVCATSLNTVYLYCRQCGKERHSDLRSYEFDYKFNHFESNQKHPELLKHNQAIVGVIASNAMIGYRKIGADPLYCDYCKENNPMPPLVEEAYKYHHIWKAETALRAFRAAK